MEAIYMSSSLDENHIDASVAIYLREVNNIFIQASTRSDGIPIRPVYDPE